MTKQVTGSVRSRKKWKTVVDAAIKSLVECPPGSENKQVVLINFPHFYNRGDWLPEGRRIKLLDKSAVWEYDSVSVVKAAYKANLTDTSYSDIIKLKREFSLKGYEDDLEKLIEINVKE